MRKARGGVAFFDSGIGGLTVVNACRKWLPDTLFYYYGDNEHAPYGNLTTKKIKKYVFRVFKRFEKLQVGAAVVACNTATAVCIDELRKKFKFPIIGAEPAVFCAAQRGEKVLVLTTKATYNSTRFCELCARVKEFYPRVSLRLFPCEGLAGEIERHIFEEKYDYAFLFPEAEADVVVLGCTHYVYVASQIEAFYNCSIVDGNEGIARRLKSIIEENNLSNEHLQPLNNTIQPFMLLRRPFLRKLANNNEGEWEGKSKKKTTRAPKREKWVDRNKEKRQEGVVFLGKNGKYNKTVYEHLFL